MAIVIVIIPISIGMPTVTVFIPPTMPLAPAAFPRLVQFVPRMIRLPAVPAVVLHGFVEFVVRFGNTALATAVVVRQRTRRPGKGQQARKNCSSEHGPPEKLLLSHLKLHILSILRYFPLAEMGRGLKL